jgi:hypothetical protein
MSVVLLAGLAAAQVELRDNHPNTYVVQRGDTLWDIAGRFLARPWQWPEIWQANPQIRNPHLIYPGDVISLAYLNGRPGLGVGPQMRVGEPVGAVPLSEIETWLRHRDVVTSVDQLPHVIGLEDDRLLASAGQLAYVRGMGNPAPGTPVELVRPIHRFALGHDRRRGNVGRRGDLDFRGDLHHTSWTEVFSDRNSRSSGGRRGELGLEVARASIGEVIRSSGEITTVLLREEHRDVRVGDRIQAAEGQVYDNQYLPHAPANIPSGAVVLAVTDGMHAAGPRYVIALSVGSRDGVDNGTVFSLWHDGARRPDDVRHRNGLEADRDMLDMPDEFNGRAMVFRTFDNVSYALVMEGIRPIRAGDLLKHPDAVQ